MDAWTTPPTFAAGQILSAAQHLNALARGVQLCFDGLVGAQTPFNGIQVVDPYGGAPWTTWDGWLKHQYNTLHYVIEVGTSGGATLSVNETVVLTLASAGVQTGDLDISGLSLVVGTHYEVLVETVSGANDFIVWELHETETISWPTLADFSDDDVPSAAEWQDLSDALTLLHNRQTAAQPCFATSPAPDTAPPTDSIWAGTFVHRAARLYYNIEIDQTVAGDENENVTATIYLDGVAVLVLTVEDGGGVVSFIDSLELATCDNPPDWGAVYQVQVMPARNDWWNGRAPVRVWLLYESGGADAAPAGWAALPTWAHPDTVTGDSGAKPVGALVTNLNLLMDTAAYRNPAFLNARSDYLHGLRQHRWLHYTHGDSDAPTLLYTAAEAQSVGLPTAWVDEAQTWQVYDLDSAPGLYAGMAYLIYGAQCAYEDDDAEA